MQAVSGCASPASADPRRDAQTDRIRTALRWAGRRAAILIRFDTTGIFTATFFLCWSLTPSLLPRGWLFQGIVGGISAALGYGAGVALGWAIQRLFLRRRGWWPLPWRVLMRVRAAVWLVCACATVGMLILSAHWQRQLAALMDAHGVTTTGYIRTGLVTAGVFAAIITASRVLRGSAQVIGLIVTYRTPLTERTGRVMGGVVVASLVVVFVGELVIPAAESVGDRIFVADNAVTPADAAPPRIPERSGSPESLVPWNTLGREGRAFVSHGWRGAQLARETGRPAKEPVRLYTGLESAPTPQARMSLLRAEMARTGALGRAAVVVVPTTGTGWVDEAAAESIELMYGGDTALIAAQYSYEPSVVSFLTHRGKAEAAGKRLIDTVHEAVMDRPKGARPRLYVYGESLGVTAGEGAFAGLADIRRMVDGVLWAGPPHYSRLWHSLVSRRDPGSSEADPVFADGMVVRFAGDTEEIEADQHGGDLWLAPRVLYIQHASDPVVWWSMDLLFHRPDWLSEAPGPDRLVAMRWFPLVTFWQVSADLAMAADVPDGHGHNYGSQLLDGWVAVAAPPGWTDADTERMRALLERERAQEHAYK